MRRSRVLVCEIRKSREMWNSGFSKKLTGRVGKEEEGVGVRKGGQCER
jgi:hypothetical protein